MFSSYIKHPTKTSYEGQDQDEAIILLLRAHPITNLSWIFTAVLIFFLPFILPDLLLLLGFDLAFLPSDLATAFLIINYLLVLVIVFEGFLHWYFNVTLVTSKKVVDIDFDSLLSKKVDLAPLANIEEANSRISGLIATIFHFGDVHIQTAGAKVSIDILKVPYPSQVADLILDLSGKT